MYTYTQKKSCKNGLLRIFSRGGLLHYVMNKKNLDASAAAPVSDITMLSVNPLSSLYSCRSMNQSIENFIGIFPGVIPVKHKRTSAINIVQREDTRKRYTA